MRQLGTLVPHGEAFGQPGGHAELEVLQLLIRGRSNKEIGTSLFISEDTVKAHLKTLFSKLHVQDHTEAAITAIRHGIVHLG